MEENFAIILDTNVFGKKSHYNFKSGIIFRVIQMLKYASNIDVFIPDIVLRELEKHIKECIAQDQKILSRYTRQMLPDNFFETVQNNKFEELMEFISKNDIKIIDCEKYLNLEEINNWYFEQRKPFEKSKPKEFPDAMIISALGKYFKNSKYQNICVISADKGFKDGVESVLECKVYKELKDIIKEIFGFDPSEYRKIEAYLHENKVLMNPNLLYLESADSHDIIDISIDDYDINSIEIINSDDKETIVLANYNLKVSGDIFIIDPESSIYDREEGKYVYQVYKTTDELYIKNIEVYLACQKNSENYFFEYDVVQEDVIDITKYLDEMEFYFEY